MMINRRWHAFPNGVRSTNDNTIDRAAESIALADVLPLKVVLLALVSLILTRNGNSHGSYICV